MTVGQQQRQRDQRQRVGVVQVGGERRHLVGRGDREGEEDRPDDRGAEVGNKCLSGALRFSALTRRPRDSARRGGPKIALATAAPIQIGTAWTITLPSTLPSGSPSWMRLSTVRTITAPIRPTATPSTACSRLAKRLVSSLNPPDRERARPKADQGGHPEEEHQLPELGGGPDPPHLHRVEERGGEDEAAADGAQNVLQLLPPGAVAALALTPLHLRAGHVRIVSESAALARSSTLGHPPWLSTASDSGAEIDRDTTATHPNPSGTRSPAACRPGHVDNLLCRKE